ncbi:hypothetical protein DL98DRAFT_570017 [Cadophora sp. DSE1049]|nr:hypothetical protein DL98DRAFT_570017 [Cadophora sp. DSE1049]
MSLHAQFSEGTTVSRSTGESLSRFAEEDDVEEVMSTKVSRSGSTAKASRILRESEEIVLRQQTYLPLHRRTRETFPDFGSQSPRSISQRLGLNPGVLTSTSTIHRKRTCSAPASSMRASLAGDDILPLDTRRSTVANTGSATFGPRSTSEPTTPPSGRERRRSSVASNLRLVIHRARSVKKKLMEKRGSRELESPVIEESDSRQGDLHTYMRGQSFSLDLPLHVSQDKSEIEYIRRKNMDAYMGRNSDIPPWEDSKDEQVMPFVEKGGKTTQGQESRIHPRLPVQSSDISTSASPPVPTISSLDRATIENEVPGLTIPSTAKTQHWNIVDYQSITSNVLPAKSTITHPMSPNELRTFSESSTADTVSKTSEQVGTVELFCNEAMTEPIPEFEELRLNNEAESKSKTHPATFQETTSITARAGSNVPQESSNPKTTRSAGGCYRLCKSPATRMDLKQRKVRAKVFSKLTDSPTNWELWTFTAEDMREVQERMNSELQTRLYEELEHSARDRKRKRCFDHTCIYEDWTEPRRRSKLRRLRITPSSEEDEFPDERYKSLDEALEHQPEFRIWEYF